jgi:transcriptional regulator with XRE-family HTH domain
LSEGHPITSQSEILSHFLRARRSALDPAALGYPVENRRVAGLRRFEVAELAGISSDYYVRLEQGRGHRMSDQVLASLARALNLDDDQRRYFYRLAQPTPTSSKVSWAAQPVSDTVLSLMELQARQPVHVFDSNLDVIVINEMADLVLPHLAAAGDNILLTTFAAPLEWQNASDSWQQVARRSVAALRFHGDPEHPRYQQIVDHLLASNRLFQRWWAEHDARPLTEGSTPIRVEGFGLVEFSRVHLEIPDGFFMSGWFADPGTPGHDVLEHFRANRLTGRPVRGPMAGWPTATKS